MVMPLAVDTIETEVMGEFEGAAGKGEQDVETCVRRAVHDTLQQVGVALWERLVQGQQIAVQVEDADFRRTAARGIYTGGG